MGEYGNSIEQYDVYGVLGKGGFAMVYRASCHHSGLEVAIKKIDKKLMERAGMVDRVKQEISIHSRLQHPSILKLYTTFEDREFVYMVLELCHNGDLQKYLKTVTVLSEVESYGFLRPIVEGLDYLHFHQIVHRDMSLANILLTRENDVKISDFGLSTFTRPDKKHMTMCGTPNYISPEVATSSEHGLEADVWGLGIMLFTMLVGRPPFDHEDGVRSTLTRVVMSDVDIPHHLSIEARDLISLLLRKSPRDRIQLKNILRHPFMRKNSCLGFSSASSSRLDSNNLWLSRDSGLASSFQTSPFSRPVSQQTFPSSSGRLPVINGALRNQQHQVSCDSNNSNLLQPVPTHAPSSTLPCCNGHLPTGNRREDCSHCNPSCGHGHVCSSNSVHYCHQLPVSVPPVVVPSGAKMPTPPFNSQRLQPIRQKTKSSILNILENGEVCLELMETKEGTKRIYEVLRISQDGMRIVLYQPNRGKGVPSSSSPPPLPSSGADLIFSHENLPEKYWKKYSYAAKFVDLVKTKTPKVTFYSKSAKCFLMENSPDPDFEAYFYEGGKMTKSGNEVKLIESNGSSFTFDYNTTNPRLSPSGQLMWEHFGKCLKHCQRVESSMDTLGLDTEDACFPITIGRRPPEYARVLQSSGNKENLSPIAPSAVNVQRIGGYEASVISARSSKAGSGSSRRKKVIRECEIPTGGRVVQYSNGDIHLNYNDGSSLMINSTSPIVTYVSGSGQTVQYKETDPIPPNIQAKLSQVSEIVNVLMPLRR